MNKTDLVIAAARQCIGTPFHHQGRLAGVGLDCIGLVVHALRAVGMTVQDQTNYGKQPDGSALAEALLAHGAITVPSEERKGGDILLFRFHDEPQHVALATEKNDFIHAYAPAGKVVAVSLNEVWRRRLWGVYRFDFGD